MDCSSCSFRRSRSCKPGLLDTDCCRCSQRSQRPGTACRPRRAGTCHRRAQSPSRNSPLTGSPRLKYIRKTSMRPAYTTGPRGTSNRSSRLPRCKRARAGSRRLSDMPDRTAPRCFPAAGCRLETPGMLACTNSTVEAAGLRRPRPPTKRPPTVLRPSRCSMRRWRPPTPRRSLHRLTSRLRRPSRMGPHSSRPRLRRPRRPSRRRRFRCRLRTRAGHCSSQQSPPPLWASPPGHRSRKERVRATKARSATIDGDDFSDRATY
jgi:hypothetical protein